jgi:hypothetical protein
MEKSPNKYKKIPRNPSFKASLTVSFTINWQYKKESHNISGIPRAKNVWLTSFRSPHFEYKSIKSTSERPIIKMWNYEAAEKWFLFRGEGEQRGRLLVYTAEVRPERSKSLEVWRTLVFES